MRRLAVIAAALAACVASVPCMAAPLPYDCRVSAQSDELRSTAVANVAARQPVLAPVIIAQLNYVGRNPYRHITIAGRRTVNWT